jgi:hypothetical protein
MANFGQIERRRQSIFRDSSNTISDVARKPADSIGQRNHHLLAEGCEQENLYPFIRGPEGALRFFSDRKIKWWRSTRSGDTAGVNAPTRNLASSQTACVNFLLPLASITGALATCLKVVDKDVQSVINIEYDGFNSPVEFEWLGCGSTLEKSAYTRGANATSADAFMLADCKGGVKRAYLFEWKYVESYEIGDYKGEGPSGETRRRRYKNLYEANDSSFTGAVPFDELLFEPIYQIMRLRLLADRMVRCSEFGVNEATVVVVCPQENLEYRDQITSRPLATRLKEKTSLEAAIKSSLKDPTGFIMTSQEQLGTALMQKISDARIADWYQYHSGRYGWTDT